METLTENDEGKAVVTPDGERVGTVSKVDYSVAHVDLAESVAADVRSRLGWGDDGPYEIREEQVAGVTDDEVRLAEL